MHNLLIAIHGFLDEPPPPGGGICAQTDPELFHLETFVPTQIREALTLCRGCPVLYQCDEWASRGTETDQPWWGKTVVGGRYYNRDGVATDNNVWNPRIWNVRRSRRRGRPLAVAA